VTAPTKLVLDVEGKKKRGRCAERGGCLGGLRNGMDGEWGMRNED